ncbi:MAG: hypothetical protein IJS03_04410 [Eubacterium sp.]|nr:hypothetical protein [Eubacterium sp.]
MKIEPEIVPERSVSDNIKYYTDGKYRWTYDMNLFTNPSIFILIWMIFFFIILGIFTISIIADAIQWTEIFRERLMYNLRFFCYFIIGMTVVSGLGYAVYAMIMGGKYCVIFEMDENGINHKQTPDQAKKAKKIGAATMAAGAAGGSLSTIGIGINATRTEMYSEFKRVKKVKAYPSRKVIKVNETLNHNQVYCQKEDFEWVKNYIITHCPNLK